jgi:tetratricopeptide (TPR) repeat protein
VGAETLENIFSSLLHIADVLQLPERDNKGQQQIVAAVQRWFTTHSQWLLIWDNVENLALLDRFLPSIRQGAILLTTRCQALGTFAFGIDLLPMESEEGTLFLLHRAKVLEPEATNEQLQHFALSRAAEYAAAADLFAATGGLPLALDQAGAYLEETQCGLPAYLELFRTQRAILLQQRGEGSRDHPASVSATFALAIAATAERHPAAQDLLQVCALLQPDAIPEELFRQGADQLGCRLEAVCCDVLQWNQVIASACSYSLLYRQPKEQTFSMHRLVQAVLLDAMTEQERTQWLQRTINALDAVFPNVIYANWKQCERLLPHVLLCLQHSGTTEDSLECASLAFKAAQYTRSRGRYAEAEPLFQRALRIRELVLGSDHLQISYPLSDLALLYWQQNKYAEAEPLFQRALRIQEQALGPDHPDLAFPLNHLANLYRDQGKYAEAEPLFQRALCIREQALGPDHFQVAVTLNNLALLYKSQGKYEKAEPLFRRALSIHKQINHPDIAYPLNNLANLYCEHDKYAEAEPLFQQALHIWEQTLGPDHPDTARALNNLAITYQVLGKYTEAEPLFQRALRIWEQTLGPDHPYIAHSLNGLANLSREQGKYVEAEAFFQRALSIREQHLGQHHPETADTLHSLALFREQQGNLSEALSLTKRALQIFSQSLGDTHHETITTQELYTRLVQAQACTQKAAPSEPETEEIHAAVEPSPTEDDPLQGFLGNCCELHPRVWCRVSDLWQAYEQWTTQQQERFPLSRRAFAAQLKVHGCCAAHTSTARIWRGIKLVNNNH